MSSLRTKCQIKLNKIWTKKRQGSQRFSIVNHWSINELNWSISVPNSSFGLIFVKIWALFWTKYVPYTGENTGKILSRVVRFLNVDYYVINRFILSHLTLANKALKGGNIFPVWLNILGTIQHAWLVEVWNSSKNKSKHCFVRFVHLTWRDSLGRIHMFCSN